MASQMCCCRSCSQFKTQPHFWSMGCDGETTPRRCYATITQASAVRASGCQSDSASISKSTVWPSNHWLAKYRNTYPATAVLSLDRFERQTHEPASFHNYRDRSFSVSGGPQQWNTLPTELRQAHTKFEHFKRQLKTFLFRDHGALWVVDIDAFKNFYLLTY